MPCWIIRTDILKDMLKIIIVDDSKVFLEALQENIKKVVGCVVIGVHYNGKELVESPYLKEADLILSDIEMPEMNGLEAARRVNYKFPKIHMIALTVHVEKFHMQEIIEAGFKGFIHKPEVSKKLSSVIKAVVKNKFVFPDNLKLD